MYRYKTDLEQISGSSKKDKNVVSVDELTKQIVELYNKKDRVVQDLNIARAAKQSNRQIADDYQARLDETRQLVNKANAEQAHAEIDLEKAKAIISKFKFRHRN